ncbi:WD40-repeat-containing domain protein [Globomyces pollinis-pini]|nr:WD40-repeat-containing domain protein [Globomyces pollinis-pini]
MFCAISGSSPVDPVISKSGYVFEKKLIQKHLNEKGTCPVTNVEMNEDDLLPVLSNPIVKPRQPTATSIPHSLLSLQNEWDAIMLETFELKKQYKDIQTQLSTALYENDAAKRVIARLIKERDDARTKLSNFKASYKSHDNEETQDVEMETVPYEPLPELVTEALDATSERLSALRKKRKAPPTLASVEQLASFQEINEIKSLNTAKDPCVNSIELQSQLIDGEPREWILTGGNDGTVSIVDKATTKLLCSAKAATKNAVYSTAWVGNENKFLTGSADNCVKVWSVNENTKGYKMSADHNIKIHTGAVRGITVHPTHKHFVSVGEDSVWNFCDIERGESIVSVQDSTITSAYTAAQLHPDGLILGTGSEDSVFRLWDLKSRVMATALNGHTGPISSISFSENGYHLATTSSSDSFVKFWDLRKLSEFHTLQMDIPDGFQGVNKVRFDNSGKYVGVTHGPKISLYTVKKWDEIVTYENHNAAVTDFVFGPDAQYLVSSSTERKVAFIGA